MYRVSLIRNTRASYPSRRKRSGECIESCRREGLKGMNSRYRNRARSEVIQRQNYFFSGRGVSNHEVAIKSAGARGLSPRYLSISSHSSLICFTSSSLNWIFAAPRFSSIYAICLLPGIGMISSPCARSHASVICAGVAFECARPMERSASVSALMRGKLAALYLGMYRRQSFSGRSSGER